MKKVWNAYLMYLRQVWNDIMLAVVFFVPILIGVVFHFGVPKLEEVLCKTYHTAEILTPYYELFDLTIMLMTPIMFAYSGVMVVLEEMDQGLAKNLAVTPLGKKGYLLSRIIMMSFLSSIYSFIVVMILKISKVSCLQVIMMGVLSSLVGIMIAFAIIGFAHNKVEGLALSKFSAILLIGFFIPVFVSEPIRYLVAFMPTFWMMEYCYFDKTYAIIISVLLCLGYIGFFYKKFERKLYV